MASEDNWPSRAAYRRDLCQTASRTSSSRLTIPLYTSPMEGTEKVGS
jgi:hypothetical protein